MLAGMALTFAAIATGIAIVASAIRGKRYLHVTEPLARELAEGAAESAGVVGLAEDPEQVVPERVVPEQVQANGTLAGTEHLGADGEAVWMQPRNSTDEAELDAYIERALRIDPDLWVVEIDDPDGRHFLVEPVERG